jgi:polyadenylate-binding protein
MVDMARIVIYLFCMFVCTFVGPGQQPVGAANIQGRPMAPTVSVSAQGRQTNYKYTANMRNPPQPMPVAQQPPVQQVRTGPLQ